VDGLRELAFAALGVFPRACAIMTPWCGASWSIMPKSASGDSGDHRRMPFPHEHIHRLPGLHHLHLLNHPCVHRQIHSWLVTRPDDDGSTSAFPHDKP